MSLDLRVSAIEDGIGFDPEMEDKEVSKILISSPRKRRKTLFESKFGNGVMWIPVKSKDSETCLRAYEQAKVIAYGATGTIASVQKSGNPYILKVVPFIIEDEELENRREMFNREVFYLNLLQPLGITPKLYASWICEDCGYYVMDRWDGDLDSLMEKDLELITRITRTSLSLKIPEDWWNRIKEILKILSSQGIIHGDLKLDQFLYRWLDKEKKQIEICLTDFEFSFDFKRYKPLGLGWQSVELGCEIPKTIDKNYNLWNLYLQLSRMYSEIHLLKRNPDGSVMQKPFVPPLEPANVQKLNQLCNLNEELKQRMLQGLSKKE